MEDKQELTAAKYLRSHLEQRKEKIKPELLYKPVAEIDYKDKGEAKLFLRTQEFSRLGMGRKEEALGNRARAKRARRAKSY